MKSNIHPSVRLAGWRSRLLVAAFLSALVTACSLSTPYPNRSFFTIDSGSPDSTATSPAAAAAPAHNVTLRVRRIVAVPPYGGSAFVYQKGPHSIATDYYNFFAAPPADILSAQLVQWLRASHVCATVTDGSGGVTSQWTLEGRLQELAVDGTNPAKPQAVIQLQFVLLDETGVLPIVMLDKVYTEQSPIASLDAKAAADGWSAASRMAFQQVADDLRQMH